MPLICAVGIFCFEKFERKKAKKNIYIYNCSTLAEKYKNETAADDLTCIQQIRIALAGNLKQNSK